MIEIEVGSPNFAILYFQLNIYLPTPPTVNDNTVSSF